VKLPIQAPAIVRAARDHQRREAWPESPHVAASALLTPQLACVCLNGQSVLCRPGVGCHINGSGFCVCDPE
jgi:hypothetical protein